MYSIVWQYHVDLSNRAVFEQEYGSHGSWHALFRRSDQYLGSYLHKSDTDPRHYLLVDTWTTRAAYEEFLEVNRVVYNELSARLQHLYISEHKLGTFVSI